ncbi:unnamed protein product [Parascedosporium putredinis]|uniref:Alcohol dehydrogenase-like C-terminal domain-containing protein n=1 Tax=Parascedosporium putredinis TaxID=1442378 RepID=A0A9P1GZH7_9PEZI|nr:unnamed protein product [Parascedosporium putredinis]CAI7991818.1 unnamed protein product [Parascedosporium putredinis]
MGNQLSSLCGNSRRGKAPLRLDSPDMAPIKRPALPSVQTQLLLHQPRSPYETFAEGIIPELKAGELLVQVEAIAVGDQVLAVATDYRDFRKSAFQEYAVVCGFNAIKIPKSVDPYQAASLGGKLPDLDFLSILQRQGEENVPKDCYEEIFNPIPAGSRPHRGEWVLLYGASSVTAQLCAQLAKVAGLKVIGVADLNKHGDRLRALGVDVIVDRKDLDLAAKEVRKHTQGSLRFALDFIGKDTSAWCQNLLAACASSRYPENRDDPDTIPDPFTQKGATLSHLVCLTGAPKARVPNVRVHQVPVKMFHENEELGCVLSYWLYHSLKTGVITLPETQIVDGGLEAVNSCLELMRRGEVSGSRLVVRVK